MDISFKALVYVESHHKKDHDTELFSLPAIKAQIRNALKMKQRQLEIITMVKEYCNHEHFMLFV